MFSRSASVAAVSLAAVVGFAVEYNADLGSPVATGVFGSDLVFFVGSLADAVDV